jgi:signal peptidase I
VAAADRRGGHRRGDGDPGASDRGLDRLARIHRGPAEFRNPRPAGAADPRWLVKRVAAIEGAAVPPDIRPAAGGHAVVPEGCFVVRGDNPASLDSRRFGYAARRDVLGVALRS